MVLHFDWFDAMHYILTSNGSFLRFKDRNTGNQKSTEKKLIRDRNCCSCSLQHILPTVHPCPSNSAS